MRYIFTCIIIGCFSISNAQTVNLEWAKAFSGTRYEEGNSIAVDAAGSLYSTGIFEGTVDFDPGPGIYNITSSGSIDIFISKQDAAGNFIWAKNIGGSSSEYGKSIAIDQTGNVYITGGFLGTVDFDPGPNTYNLTSTSVPAGGYNIFVCKLNGSGNFVWAKNLGGGGSENFGNSIFVDAANNVCVTGFFGGTVDFDPGPGNYNLISVGGYDIFIAKLDASGNLIWAKSMGGSSDDRGYSIKMDVSGNIYAAGFFHFTVDFDPGPANYSLTSPGNYATFIIKLNNSGNLVWAKSMGGVGSVVCNSIVTDPGNNVFLTGHFSGTADFDPGPGTFNLTPAGGSDIDIYVAKLDAAGNFAWAKNMGGTSGENSNSIARDAPGNLYITGYFRGTSDFDPGPGISNLTSVSNVDIFISKLDAAGNFAWAKNMGGISSMPLGTFNLGNAIVADAAANVYAIGSFQGAGDFDPGPGTFNLTSASSSTDVFIVKFNQVIPGTTTLVTSSINPSTVAQSVTFTATVTAASGTPAGTVSFYDGTTLLGTGTLTGNTATFSTSTLTSGSHNITAVYNGNANYSSSTSSILTQVVTVPVVTTTTSLVSSLNPSTVSQNVTFTATVTAASGTPTGTVSFYDGTTLLGTGTLTGNTATSSTSTLTAGSHNITAVYNGNVNYSSSTSSVLTQVVTIPVVTTTTSLASSLNPSTVGQGVIFTATVSAASGTPTGTVSFYDGTTLLGTGTITGNTATLSTSSLTAGSHNITAVFSSGTANYSSSTSAVVIQFVNAVTGAIPTTTSVISSGNFTAARQNVTFTATVTATSGIPTGTISFFDGPTLVATSALSANTATYSTSALVIGWHTITAKYNGNINYLPSTSSVSHTVTTITPAKLLHLYPNPIIGNTIAFQLNMEHGKYAVSLTTAIGQTILTKTIQHNGGSVIHTIELPQGVSAGIYGLTITGTGIIFIRKVIKY